MNIVDRLLLLMMILLLPIGLVASYSLFPEDNTSFEDLQEQRLKQIDGLISQLTYYANQNKEDSVPITVTKTEFKEVEGVLRVEGTTPRKDASVLVTATVLPPNGESLSEEESIKGLSVETVMVPTNSKAQFIYEFEVEKDSDGVVELLIEQRGKYQSVKFDLATGKRLN